MNKNIGFMQGRLSPLYRNKIQCFPKSHWESEFSIANSLGLNKMEWTLDHEDLLKNPLLNISGQKKIKSLTKKYKIEIPSVTGDCFMQKPFWHEKNQHMRNILNHNFDLICESCEKLSINFIVIPLVDNGKLENEYQENLLIDWLTSKYSFLKKSKLNVLFEMESNPKKIKNFIKNFESDVFGINYDIGNSASLGYNPIDEFEAYGERIKNVHVKDRLLGGSTVPLGEGAADFRNVFKCLHNIEYMGNFILQTARSYNEKHSFVLKSYSLFINKFVEEFKLGI